MSRSDEEWGAAQKEMLAARHLLDTAAGCAQRLRNSRIDEAHDLAVEIEKDIDKVIAKVNMAIGITTRGQA